MSRNRFIVDLGKVELSDAQVRQIEASVQKAALGALATIDFRGDLVARFPKEWIGIWIDIGHDVGFEDKLHSEFAPR